MSLFKSTFSLFRYWGKDNYEKLLSVKMKWDPTMVFGCHHCVGDDESPGVITKDTLPYWRFDHQYNVATRHSELLGWLGLLGLLGNLNSISSMLLVNI